MEIDIQFDIFWTWFDSLLLSLMVAISVNHRESVLESFTSIELS